jgi:hypothetical protein
MPESAIRFTVRNESGQRAATWKCWSEPAKSDVYLACRELGGALKSSLHGSGRWHVAYAPSFFEESVSEQDRTERGRFIDKWARPKSIVPGVSLAYRIITPWSSVTAEDRATASIVRIPAPPEGRAIECDVFLLDRSRNMDWPGKTSMKTQPVGSYRLPTGDIVWIVWWEIAMPKLGALQGRPKFYRGRTMDDLKKGERVRALLFGDEPDGSKTILDVVARFGAHG